MSHGGVNKCDGKTFKEFKSKDGTSYSVVLFILGDAKGNIWFGGINGFWKYDGEKVTHMTRNNK